MLKLALGVVLSAALAAPVFAAEAEDAEATKSESSRSLAVQATEATATKATKVSHMKARSCLAPMQRTRGAGMDLPVGAQMAGAGMQLDSGLVPMPNWLPKYDREKFIESATSIQRADLLACRNRDARPQNPGNVDIAQFAKDLTGVWINQNRRTVHGVPVETDAVFVIDMRKDAGTGVLIDINNLGNDKFSRQVKELGLARATKPMKMSFVNCRYEFWDEYIKVSNTPDVRVLSPAARDLKADKMMALEKSMSLEDAWKTIRKSGFFEGIQMYRERAPQLYLDRDSERQGKREYIEPELGDGERVAITPSGRLVNEREIDAGLAPGAEYYLPMKTGALFEISLREVDQSMNNRRFRGVSMMWNAVYTGTGLGFEPNTDVLGFEQGEFLNESGSYVAPAHLAPWRTSDCGDKNGLATPSLTFDRVVIGP